MRTSLAIILAALVCVMLITSGCTSSSGTSPAATTAIPTSSVPAPAETTVGTITAPAPSAQSWAGTWNTSYGSKDDGPFVEIMVLTQTGSSVTGTYNLGNGTVSAKVQDGRLTGSWHDSDSNGTYSGLFDFERSADEKSFTGRWVAATEGAEAMKNTTQYWNGIRV